MTRPILGDHCMGLPQHGGATLSTEASRLKVSTSSILPQPRQTNSSSLGMLLLIARAGLPDKNVGILLGRCVRYFLATLQDVIATLGGFANSIGHGYSLGLISIGLWSLTGLLSRATLGRRAGTSSDLLPGLGRVRRDFSCQPQEQRLSESPSAKVGRLQTGQYLNLTIGYSSVPYCIVNRGM